MMRNEYYYRHADSKQHVEKVRLPSAPAFAQWLLHGNTRLISFVPALAEE
jgi:hypothetical protein